MCNHPEQIEKLRREEYERQVRFEALNDGCVFALNSGPEVVVEKKQGLKGRFRF